jgi:hypothetical protein
MTKIIRVESCKECPHRETYLCLTGSSPLRMSLMCSLNLIDLNDNGDKFCPLEDAPIEKSCENCIRQKTNLCIGCKHIATDYWQPKTTNNDTK